MLSPLVHFNQSPGLSSSPNSQPVQYGESSKTDDKWLRECYWNGHDFHEGRTDFERDFQSLAWQLTESANAAFPQSRKHPSNILWEKVDLHFYSSNTHKIYSSRYSAPFRLQFIPRKHLQIFVVKMNPSTNEETEVSSFKPFTKMERIQQLNAIDKVIIPAQYMSTPHSNTSTRVSPSF